MRSFLIIAPLLLLGACSKTDNEPGPGGVTTGEARALDEAAEMIEGEGLPPPPSSGPSASASASAPPASPTASPPPG